MPVAAFERERDLRPVFWIPFPGQKWKKCNPKVTGILDTSITHKTYKSFQGLSCQETLRGRSAASTGVVNGITHRCIPRELQGGCPPPGSIKLSFPFQSLPLRLTQKRTHSTPSAECEANKEPEDAEVKGYLAPAVLESSGVAHGPGINYAPPPNVLTTSTTVTGGIVFGNCFSGEPNSRDQRGPD